MFGKNRTPVLVNRINAPFDRYVGPLIGDSGAPAVVLGLPIIAA